MPAIPSPVALAPAVLGGYALGRTTGNRKLAGVALVAGLGAVVPRWAAASPVLAAALAAGTVGLVGLSHPLSRRTGPWPAVLTTTAAAAALAAVGDRLTAPR
ncbi:hypothetical protein AB2L27_06875 [Kineococcus sp. LSe6-4]|uniref:Uncharacterized protein n=1 Tax=Kineococcus halophytocola TaxID=3234027 RepID=A0ABV4GZI8_9ACTN